MLLNNGNELQRSQVHASACIGRRSGFTLWVNSDTANNLNQNQWLTPALSGQLPDLGSSVWPHQTVIGSAAELMNRLQQDVTEAVSECVYKSFPFEREAGGEPSGFWRVKVEIPVSLECFESFFRGPAGYRAQYYKSAECGEAFNRACVQLISPILQKKYRTLVISAENPPTLEDCRKSIDQVFTKIWLPKSVSDPLAGWQLETADSEPWNGPPRWVDYPKSGSWTSFKVRAGACLAGPIR